MNRDNSFQAESRTEWLSHIRGLSDRQLRRRQASGVTAWALVGFLAFLIRRVIVGLPEITAPNKFRILLVVVVALAGLAIAIFTLARALRYQSNMQQSRRLIGNLDLSVFPRVIGPFALILIGLALVTFWIPSLSGATFGVPSWVYYFLGFLFLLSSIAAVGAMADALRQIKNPGPTFSLLFSQPGIAQSSLVRLIDGMIFSIPPLYILFRFSSSGLLMDNIPVLLMSLDILVILLILVVLLLTLAQFAAFEWLIALEDKIITDQIPTDQIKGIFIAELLGQEVLDWIRTTDREIQTKLRGVLDSAAKVKDKLCEIDVPDKYPHEIRARCKEICDDWQSQVDDFLTLTHKHLDDLQKLFKQHAFSDENSLLIKELVAFWRQQIGTIKQDFDNMCSSCAKAKLADEPDTHSTV